jgi:hypothetical protein
MYLKAGLFLAILGLSVAVIINETRSWKVAVLLAAIIWSAARLYYFMFYVIEKYVDPGYRFAGVFAFVRYLMGRKKSERD